MNKTVTEDLEHAASLVFEAIKLLKEYPILRRALENTFDQIDNLVDYESERIAQEAE
jgi:hypothetical protein